MHTKNKTLHEMLGEFEQLSIEYSEACRRLTKLRLLAEYPKALDEDVLAYAKARRRHKLFCKSYYERKVALTGQIRDMQRARSTIQSLMLEAKETLAEDEDAIAPSVEPIALGFAELQELKKQQLLEAEVESGKYDSLIAELKQKMQ